MNIIKIDIDDFMPWFEEKLDHKYGSTMQNLKNSFHNFIALVRQLIQIYLEIKTKVIKLGDQLTLNQVKHIVDHSIYYIKSMIDEFPLCLDLSFCEKFQKDFQQKLAYVCAYFHSFTHIIQAWKQKFKNQKQILISGINKLYQFTGHIKEYVKDASTVLKVLSDYKKLFYNKISSIKTKLFQYKDYNPFGSFQTISVQYTKTILSRLETIKQQDESKYQFMSTYFKLYNHFLSVQTQIESMLQYPIKICQEIKVKRKHLNLLNSEPNWNTLSKYVNIIIKSNFVSKHLKKIKIEEFLDFIKLINSQKQFQGSFDNVIELDKYDHRLKQVINMMLEDMKQLQKIEKSQIFYIVTEYKDKLMGPGESKKFIEKLIEYQNWMYKYYKLNEQIKSLQKIAQTIVIKETKIKIQLVISC